ncbi:MAG: allophanate hydrolase, partial [Bryobacteraceae bacterium]|nr:allophanate hydrolase [Bryobacteraceae bacterium]
SRADAIRQADSVSPDLPLAGHPFAIKDNIDSAGLDTTAGCPAFAYRATRHATVVDKLTAAGAVLIGKTNMDQFATGLVGVRSPYGACSSVFDPRYISGGSSSGSAVAVASGLVDFSLGTDTAGSGRVPAAFNNLIGLKPTRGLLSMRGVVPACRSLDCVSIFTRTISRAAAVLDAASGFDPEDPFSRPAATSPLSGAGPFRFGVPAEDQLEFFGDHDARDLFLAAVRQLELAGGERVEIDYAPFREAAALLYQGPWVAERTAAVGDFLAAHPDQVHPVVRRIIEGGTKYSAIDAHRASYRLAELRQSTLPTWARIDVMLLPTTGTIFTHEQVAAEPVARNTDLGFYTNFVNLLDLAALALPAGFRPNGLPFGVTLIGPAWSDPALLRLGARFLREPLPAQLPSGWIELAVVGAHLSGQPLHPQLTERGARLLETTRTAPDYQLFALANTTPPKPGLVRAPGSSGPGIEVEVYALSAERFGSFVALIPPPLGIGNVQLAGGRTVKGFICEPAGLTGSTDITAFGGWRNFLAR